MKGLDTLHINIYSLKRMKKHNLPQTSWKSKNKIVWKAQNFDQSRYL